MKKWSLFACVLLLAAFSCGKQPVEPAPEPDGTDDPVVPDPQPVNLEHFDFYRTARVAKEVNKIIRFNRAGSRVVSEAFGTITYNEEGLKSLQESFVDGKLSGRSTFTYGDHTMHRVSEYPPGPGICFYVYDYTYEDAERKREIECILTSPDFVGTTSEGSYDRTITKWEEGRKVRQEIYTYAPNYWESEFLTKTVDKTYTFRGNIGTVCTVTHEYGGFGRKESESVVLVTTTYRDESRRQTEKAVTVIEGSTPNPSSTVLYTYNKDNLLVKQEHYSGTSSLSSMSCFTYKDNVKTQYCYKRDQLEVTETTYQDAHTYSGADDVIESPFDMPAPQGPEDYSGVKVSTENKDWILTVAYLHNSLMRGGEFCFSLQNISKHELTLLPRSLQTRCLMIGSNGTNMYTADPSASPEAVERGAIAEMTFRVSISNPIAETVRAVLNLSYKDGETTKMASFSIENLQVFDTLD